MSAPENATQLPFAYRKTNQIVRYWDEMADVRSIEQSEVFDPTTGFGGDGEGGEDGGGCVADGPFGGMVLHLNRDYSTRPYCLSRNFNQRNFNSAAARNVNECYEMDDFGDAWPCYEGHPHDAGHNGVGGVVSTELRCVQQVHRNRYRY